MIPIEHRRQSHNWSHIEDALDAGWTVTIKGTGRSKRYCVTLEGATDSQGSHALACLEWALDEIEEYLDEEY